MADELEVDEILLLRHLAAILAANKLRLVVELVRVNIIRINRVVLFVFARRIRLIIALSLRRSGSSLADLTGAVDMGQLATFLVADADVGIVWTLVHVALFAGLALFAVSQGCERTAYRGAGCGTDVCVAAFRVRAPASKEMHTGWGAVG